MTDAAPDQAAQQRDVLSALNLAAETLLICKRKVNLASEAQTRAQQDYESANQELATAIRAFDDAQRAARSLSP